MRLPDNPALAGRPIGFLESLHSSLPLPTGRQAQDGAFCSIFVNDEEMIRKWLQDMRIDAFITDGSGLAIYLQEKITFADPLRRRLIIFG